MSEEKEKKQQCSVVSDMCTTLQYCFNY